MSFAGDTKTELCRTKLTRACCAQAEACGILLFCNHFSPRQVRIITESAAFAQRLPLLFQKAFGLGFDGRGGEGPGKRVFTITQPDKLRALWQACAFDLNGPAHHINFGLLEEAHCRLAFLRGAFLAGGSAIDPKKGYHLEFSTTHFSVSRELTALLLELGFPPKASTRKSNYVTYFKQSETIEELLTAIGAPVSAMELMNAKAEKLLRNGVNRRVNCEAANVGKTVDAALEQRRAIQALRASQRLETLSPKLQEAAQLREAHPELSLSQLAELCTPPVTKSSLSHRLRKLIALSQEAPEGAEG
ncbi:MAG: DNA-binding protein WhiA [Ruminiclostridium sp.]|jgi:DNA-binding protein WhiA|nr:DNA-binding protein WhiA [Ruminiclostridium sp.]